MRATDIGQSVSQSILLLDWLPLEFDALILP